MKSAAIGALAAFLITSASSAVAVPDSPSDASHRVGFDQHVGQVISADLRFRDDGNHVVRIADYLGTGPLVLVFTYYGCSNLCPAVIGNLADRLAAVSVPNRSRPQVLVVSVDASDAPTLAAQKKHAYLEGRPSAASRWHFLTGTDSAIAPLVHAVGLRYAYDSATHQFAHPAVIVLLTPQGEIASYLTGFDFTSAQLSSALRDATARHVGSPLEQFLLVCFHYNPVTGPYTAAVLVTLRVVSAALALALCAFALLRRARRKRARASTGQT